MFEIFANRFRFEIYNEHIAEWAIEISQKLWYNLSVKRAEGMRCRLDKAKMEVGCYADKRH